MYMQIDTKDILFICGGAFVDLEKTISERYSSLTHCNLVSPIYLHPVANLAKNIVGVSEISFAT
jgi:hypothetical protein